MIYKQIECDNCYASYRTSVMLSSALMRKMMREKGWSCGKKDLCPKCAVKKGKKHEKI